MPEANWSPLPPAEAAQVYHLLGDATRLRLLRVLEARPEVCVGDLARALGQSQPLVSNHLARLRRAGLVEPRREGKKVFYRLSSPLVPLLLRPVGGD
jgi:ArsR family transcriptional regulator, arsenate/arsenite/antimonite-responsive transcriptional repressor